MDPNRFDVFRKTLELYIVSPTHFGEKTIKVPVIKEIL